MTSAISHGSGSEGVTTTHCNEFDGPLVTFRGYLDGHQDCVDVVYRTVSLAHNLDSLQ